MKYKILSIILFYFFSVLGIAGEFYPEKLAGRMVKIVLKDKNITLTDRIEVTEYFQKSEPVVIYSFLRNENGEKFFAVFTQAKGRYDPFDYLMVTNTNFTIEKISVLKYRSEHGSEIASKKWLRQFENYASGNLRYKKEISALSGATISAGSLVDDVPKVLKILKNNCN